MTLVEVLVALSIFVIVMMAVGAFEAGIFTNQNTISGSFRTAQNSQIILKTMLTELRETSPGDNGSFPIASAGSTTISFFSDRDNDGSAEKITYTLMGSTLYRAVIKATGSPAVYNVASQATTTLLSSVTNGTAIPVFQYFDTNYNGTSSPLTQPVTPTAIRLVKINIRLDLDPNRSPIPIIYSVQVNLRNLKSNL